MSGLAAQVRDLLAQRDRARRGQLFRPDRAVIADDQFVAAVVKLAEDDMKLTKAAAQQALAAKDREIADRDKTIELLRGTPAPAPRRGTAARKAPG